jgi:predicted ATPase
MPTQTTDDSDATMSGLGEADPLLIRDVMEYLGAESRRSIQTIKKLEELDINTTLQLPKFVVVGDQSAGKSSIVEALCDISLPRSSGTCTR